MSIVEGGIAKASTAGRTIKNLRWYICAILFFATTINYLDRQAMSALNPILKQEIGWDEHWICTRCGTSHQRDNNAAINLARYDEPHPGDSALGPVRTTVKRGADRKTRPVRAGGNETRKGTSQQAGKQPRDGVPVGGSL